MRSKQVHTLLIDNYDSFTYNLYQLLAEVNGIPPVVLTNVAHGLVDWSDLPFDNVVISPGPGRPEVEADLGISRRAIREAGVPLLGVCLGHQAIAHSFGCEIQHAPAVMHGRESQVCHDGEELFEGIPAPLTVIRYHSLCVADDLPRSLSVTARSEDGVIMGLRHLYRPIWGVQFHPESIGTEHGRHLLRNFRDLTLAEGPRRSTRPRPRPLSTFPRALSASKPPVRLELRHQVMEEEIDSERAFVHLFGGAERAFWLDSSRAEPGLSRFSFMGEVGGPFGMEVSHRAGVGTRSRRSPEEGWQWKEGSLFRFLSAELEARTQSGGEELPFDFQGGFVGYLGYELKAECGARRAHVAPLPDAHLLFADRLLVFDHQLGETHLLCLHDPEVPGATAEAQAWLSQTEGRLRDLPPLPPLAIKESEPPPRFCFSRPRGRYLHDIQACLANLREGESYELCLTGHVKSEGRPDPLTLHRILRRDNPAPYAAYLRFGEVAIVSSSPERFLTIDRGGQVESKPIKGTLPRGKDPAEDEALRRALAESEKDRAENLMIVDLLRNDLGRVCKVGSVHVPELMAVESYATVHQLVSTVRGTLRPDRSAVDCVRAAFPGGSMTGAPKIRSMEILDALEGEARGVYSGAIGCLGLNGAADLSIVIRTVVLTEEGCSVGAGGAIVALSDPEMEVEEVLLKARAPVEAITRALGHDPTQARVELD